MISMTEDTMYPGRRDPTKSKYRSHLEEGHGLDTAEDIPEGDFSLWTMKKQPLDTKGLSMAKLI